jgi:competence protein ComEC
MNSFCNSFYKNFLTKILPLLALGLLLGGCREKERDAAGIPGAGNPGAGKPDRYGELVRAPEKDRFTVYFLDLEVSPEAEDKSGDAALLVSPEGLTMMVDAGHPESAEGILSFLKDLGVGKIDYFILSHPHIDHIGGFPAIAGRHEIGTVFETGMEYTTETYRRYRAALEKHRIPVRVLERGDRFNFGAEIAAEVFNPPPVLEYPPNFPANSTQFINDSSLVVKFTWGDASLLLGGDIYLTRERELTDLFGEALRAVVVKANHHGSDTSNGGRWIRTVRPRVVVAMNDLIASMTVYNNYKKSGAAFYHTVLDGIVKVSMDREGTCAVTGRFESWLRD